MIDWKTQAVWKQVDWKDTDDQSNQKNEFCWGGYIYDGGDCV